MRVAIDEYDAKQGLLSLVLAIVDIIEEMLRLQALRRVDGGNLTDEEAERLGCALMDLEDALATLKADLGVTEAVQSIRESLDGAIRDLVRDLEQPALIA